MTSIRISLFEMLNEVMLRGFILTFHNFKASILKHTKQIHGQRHAFLIFTVWYIKKLGKL